MTKYLMEMVVSKMDNLFPKLPLADFVDVAVKDYLKVYLKTFFDGISTGIEWIAHNIIDLLSLGSPFILILIMTALAWWISGWKLGVFTLVGLGLINNLGYWEDTVITLSLIIVSV